MRRKKTPRIAESFACLRKLRLPPMSYTLMKKEHKTKKHKPPHRVAKKRVNRE